MDTLELRFPEEESEEYLRYKESLKKNITNLYSILRISELEQDDDFLRFSTTHEIIMDLISDYLELLSLLVNNKPKYELLEWIINRKY